MARPTPSCRSLKKKDFFANFTPIILFALVGTLLSAVVFGLGTYALILTGWISESSIGSQPLLRCLMYGALISCEWPAHLAARLRVHSPLLVPARRKSVPQRRNQRVPAATDPVSTLAIFKAVGVPSVLHSLVFGESVLNDAAVIILFEVCGPPRTVSPSN